MQFQVPQFIETEDKIVGPLSLRQFMIMAAGMGVVALLYFMLQLWIWAIISIPVIGLVTALAFIKISGRPFWKIALSAGYFYWRPQTYVWQAERPAVKGVTAREKDVAASAILAAPVAPLRAKAASGEKLREHWESVQTGEKLSASQFTENRMYERYQIFQNPMGARTAAKRVDYR